MEEITLNITEYGYIPDGKPSQDGETPARVTAVYKDRYEIICSYGTGLAALKKSSYYTGGEPGTDLSGRDAALHLLKPSHIHDDSSKTIFCVSGTILTAWVKLVKRCGM